MPRLARALLAVAVFAAAARGFGAAPEKPAAKLPSTEGWIQATSRHFTVYSSAGERTTKKIVTQLERYRMALGRITSGFNLDERVPTVLIVFRKEAAFAPYKLDKKGEPDNTAGYFLAGDFRNYVAMDASAGDSPARVVYHEYFHAVMDATLGKIPLWLNEGLADYFSTFKSDPAGAVVQAGHPIEEYLGILAERGKIPWDEVFGATADSRAYNERPRQGPFYAQSWLVVHYMAATTERTKALGRYLALLADGKDPDQALSAAFGMDRRALGAAVDAYSRKGSNYVWWDLGDAAAKTEVAIREVGPAEVLFRLGDLLARRGQKEGARLHLEAARAAGWAPGAIENSLGVAALASDDEVGGRAHLKAAVDAGGDSAEPFVLLADRILADIGKHTETLTSGAVPPQVGEARTLIARGLAIEKDSVPALTSLARTYIFETDTQPGVEAAVRALELRPRDGDVLSLEACLLAKGGKPAAAWSIVARAILPRDEKAGREAATCVAGGTLQAVAARVRAGDRPGAESVVNEALDSIRDPEARKRLEPVRAVLAAGGEITFAPAQRNPLVVAYNEAIALANAGKLDQAADRLEALAKECKDDEFCGRIRSTAAEVRQASSQRRLVERFNDAIRLLNDGKRKEARAALRELEKEVEEPELRAQIQELLKELGDRK